MYLLRGQAGILNSSSQYLLMCPNVRLPDNVTTCSKNPTSPFRYAIFVEKIVPLSTFFVPEYGRYNSKSREPLMNALDARVFIGASMKNELVVALCAEAPTVA